MMMMMEARYMSSSIVTARQVVTEMIAEIGKDHLQVQQYLTYECRRFLIFLPLSIIWYRCESGSKAARSISIADQNIRRMSCIIIWFWTHRSSINHHEVECALYPPRGKDFGGAVLLASVAATTSNPPLQLLIKMNVRTALNGKQAVLIPCFSLVHIILYRHSHTHIIIIINNNNNNNKHRDWIRWCVQTIRERVA